MNKHLKLALSGAAASALFVTGRPALAWDSICYGYNDPTKKVSGLQHILATRGCEGIDAARGRWRDPERQLDEHRRILELAVNMAGLPSSLLDTMKLTVLTDLPAITVNGKDGPVPTVAPKVPVAAFRTVYRSFALDELAQLPDFSFSLWDWARGNESCPLAPLTPPFDQAQTCHQFSSHMGATNSNHFPPQSDTWFDHYHGLATSRAAECTTTRKNIWNGEPANRRAATDARFAPFYRACEVEALVYEAVAQHFLQDSWSAGHMWQRWGSTDIDRFQDLMAQGSGSAEDTWNNLDQRFRKLLIAEIVAVSAGTIHGSDGPIYEYTGASFHDPMCYPHENVTAIDMGTARQVVGDLHLHDVVGGPPLHANISNSSVPYDVALLAGQSSRLLGCASGSIGAVYAALSDPMSFGNPILGKATVPAPAFDANNCRAPQATNLAVHEGINPTDIQPAYGEYEAVLIDDIPDSVEALARNDYGRLRRAARIVARSSPTGTELSRLQLTQAYSYQDTFCNDEDVCATITFTAQPELFTMLNARPNRCYDPGPDKTGCAGVPVPPADPLAPFADPELPTPLGAIDASTPMGTQALVFHASRAPQLCDSTTPLDLAILPNIVASAPLDELTAACEACAEWTAPFLRIGTGPGDYDMTAEPLCYFTSANAAAVPYVYEPANGTADPMSLARRRCGCKGLVAVTDAGMQRLVAKPSAGSMIIATAGPTVPVGTLPRDVAAASARRLLVANGGGQIVGVRDDVEVDMDGNANNGVTRLTFPGVGDVQGIAVANAGGKELLLASTSGSGELIAWDLTNDVQCDRFSVAQVAGQSSYDVVVSADATKVFVSVRRSAPLSGAVAVASLAAIAQCNNMGAASVQWYPTPGAVSGPGPMALSPDGSKLAVGVRLTGTCLDQIKAADGTTNVDTQVGCDRVFVMDVASLTWLQFGANISMPTRPGRYPYGVAWFADSTRLAYSTFQGIDNLGQGDSGWPAKATASPRIPVGGTLRLADTAAASYSGGGGGPGVLRYWTYNMPLNGFVIGSSVVVEGGAATDPAYVFVGTGPGRISAYTVAVHDSSPDPMWEGANADPETALHMSTNGGWYGGCSHSCTLVGGVCPMVCPGIDNPPGLGYIELGSGIRVLTAY